MNEKNFFDLKIGQYIYWEGNEVKIKGLYSSHSTGEQITFVGHGSFFFVNIMEQLSLTKPEEQGEK